MPRARFAGLLLSIAASAACVSALPSTPDPAAPVVAPAPVERHEFSVLVYNVENLFDADGIAAYEDYMPPGGGGRGVGYVPQHVARKVEMIARVVAAADPRGPEVILFNEFEEDRTPSPIDLEAELAAAAGHDVAALLAPPLLERFGGHPAEFFVVKALADAGLGRYAVVQAIWPEGDDSGKSAVKNVVLTKFPVLETRQHPLVQARAIVEAVLDVHGHPFRIFANHWKSGASNPEMELIRQDNAQVHRGRLEEVLLEDPTADVFLGGDFNSAYHQEMLLPGFSPNAVNDILGSGGDERAVAEGRAPLYNLWFELPPGRRMSDSYSGRWGTLMQMMVSPGLLAGDGLRYVDGSFKVIAVPGLNANRHTGTPFRWYFSNGGGGASDHFPILARFAVGPADDSRRAWADPASAEREPVAVAYDKVDRTRLPLAAEALPRLEGARLAEAMGGLYQVEEKLDSKRPMRVTVAGRSFQVWSFDEAVREKMQDWEVGRRVRFTAELGEFRGEPQWIVHHVSWLGSVTR